MFDDLIEDIKLVLSDDLLTEHWKKIVRSRKCHPTTGHCYAASEALYHLLGGKNSGYKPAYGKTKNGNTHWWIVDKNNNILDVTAEQFYFFNAKPPYETGIFSGFLTKQPSKRALKIINKVQRIKQNRNRK
jgi:hypothetical protein